MGEFMTIVSIAVVVLFYACVFAAVLITFWKVQTVSNDLAEIKKMLTGLKDSLDQLKSQR